METWIANLAGSYSIHRTDKHDVQVLAGVRYFSLDMGTELDANVIPGGGAWLMAGMMYGTGLLASGVYRN